jgi:hypothetical protein
MLSGEALARQPVYGQCYFQLHLVSRSLLRASSSGMLYEDAEKLYGELRVVTEALIEKALHVLYPTSLPLSSAATTHASGPLTVFAHNTMHGASDLVGCPRRCVRLRLPSLA